MPSNGNGNSRRFEFTEDETATTAVIRAHADLQNRDPTNLPLLANIIPCGALNRLVDTGEDVTVTFTYEGMETSVHADGEIVVHVPD